MERLASRQHLGWIIESLEKTDAPEPLSCVNVALQVLPAVCADCLVLRVYIVDSPSICKFINLTHQFLYVCMYYLHPTGIIIVFMSDVLIIQNILIIF